MSTNIENITTFETLPMLALRGISVFPAMLLSFDVQREASVAAVNLAMESSRRIFVLAQKNVVPEIPAAEDLFRVGTVCYLKQILRIPDGGLRVMLEGVARARVIELLPGEFFQARISVMPEIKQKKLSIHAEAVIRESYNLFEKYCALSPNALPGAIVNILNSDDPGYVADFIAQNVNLRHEDIQSIIEENRPVQRLEKLNKLLARELQILNLESEMSEKISEHMMITQREYFLKEHMKVIQAELGEHEDDWFSELHEYREEIKKLGLPPEIEEKLQKEVTKLSKQSYSSAESSVIRGYLDLCLELPWNKASRERLDIAAAEKVLEADHFGLEKVKRRILETIATRQISPDMKSPILCLVGPPGVGKTSIAMSVARALNRKFARLALGGVHDEAEIRGHRKTYIGAMPGRIISAINTSKANNPLMLLDEIDKLGSDYRGDPSSALLEALDPEQNNTFTDHYLEIPFDLSKVMFITTANSTETIPRPLLDRMEIIELNSYTDEEKLQIAKRHLIPKQRKRHGFTANQLKISDDAVREIIASYTRESGVRQLEREIAAICRKTAVKIVEGKAKSVRVSTGMLEEYLGVRKYKNEGLQLKDEIGIVRGLAWTQVGGEILEVEVNVIPGSGNLELTGNLGDVMKESAKAALSYIRSRSAKLGIAEDFYKSSDIHIHFPEGAIPKDGPSAGITMAVALISALVGAPVRRDVAMTGEITLRGRILPVGGLKEKTMAALRTGVKTVILPADNEKDLEEIDQTVRRALNFVTADHIDKILDVAIDFSQYRGNDGGGEAESNNESP